MIRLLRVGSEAISFLFLLIALPLSLDLSGQGACNLLSILAVTYYFLYSSVDLLTRNSNFRFIFTLLSLSQAATLFALLLFTLNLYQPSETAVDTVENSALFIVLKAISSVWERVLRSSTPVFILGEGLGSLIVIQSVSRFSSRRIQRAKSETLQLLFLFAAAVAYVIGSFFLWNAYQANLSVTSAALTGISITAIAFLTAIAFVTHKSNLIETSGIYCYTVLNIYHLSSDEKDIFGPRLWELVGSESLPPVLLESLSVVTSTFQSIFGTHLDFLVAAFSPISGVIFDLIYRVSVIYLATRIFSSLRKPKNPNLASNNYFVTTVVTFSRLILIAVYTNLILMRSDLTSERIDFWRWINTFSVLILWMIELLLAETQSEGKWKSS